MTSTELVTKELDLISSLIKDIEIRYEFKKSINVHFIEVKPVELFNENALYMEKEMELEDKFSELFPEEELLFITDGSLCEVNKITNSFMKKNKIELKYEMIPERGTKLFRIRALKDFDDVKRGDMGGYVSYQNTLSHLGNSWIYDNAKAYHESRIYENGKLYDEVEIHDTVEIYGDAKIRGKVRIDEYVEVFGKMEIIGQGLIPKHIIAR